MDSLRVVYYCMFITCGRWWMDRMDILYMADRGSSLLLQVLQPRNQFGYIFVLVLIHIF